MQPIFLMVSFLSGEKKGKHEAGWMASTMAAILDTVEGVDTSVVSRGRWY